MRKSAWLCGAVALMTLSVGLADDNSNWYVGAGINQAMPLRYDDGNGNTYNNNLRDFGWQALIGKTVNSWLAVEASVDGYHDITVGDPNKTSNYESLTGQAALDFDGVFSKRLMVNSWGTFQGLLKAGFSYVKMNVTTEGSTNGQVGTWVEGIGAGLSMTLNQMPSLSLRWSVRSYMDGVEFQGAAVIHQSDMQLSLIYTL